MCQILCPTVGKLTNIDNLYGKKHLADPIKLRILKWGDKPGLPSCAQCITAVVATGVRMEEAVI